MVAETILLSAFLPVIQNKIVYPAIDQLGLVFGGVLGTKEKLQKLERIFGKIQSVIVDAEERQTVETPIKNWLSDLKDLAYKAEDLLEDFEFEAQRKKKSLNQQDNIRRKDTIRRKVLSCSFYKPIMTHFRLCRRLSDIVAKIEAIADEINKFSFQSNRVPQISNYIRPQTHSYVDKETVIGREKDKEDIVSFLISDDVSKNKNNIAVLPIVAMGGMGKTTLSQLVYRDHRVESHFQANRIWWVCVSDADFDLARLTKLIIEAATGGKCELDNLELLQKRLREIISGKRCLIVLDDVWNEDPIQWNRLKTLLDCGGEGSAVIVSTRSTGAANMMATHNTIHSLEQLPEEDSWELFRRRAFREGAEQPENLVKIGKDIIKRCGGLPLAINTLGSLLQSFQNDERKWKAVLDSDICNIQDARDILPALRLSYNYLRPHLKQCFAFCAIYPKDYTMKKEELIQLWMANGYILSDGAKDLDDEGRDIFDELVSRSFFQNVEEHGHWSEFGYHGHVTCKMHDLMHDLARSIMGKECVNSEDIADWKDIPSIARHLFMSSLPELSISRYHQIHPNIRTLVILYLFYLDQKPQLSKYISELKSLRVLSWSDLHYKIDMNISRLRHVRWLDLSCLDREELPEAICSLYNLQTLNISWCHSLKKLPENFTNLVNLRHLYTNGCFNLVCMPRWMGRLKQLHTLTKYIVSTEAERGIQQLRDLNLGGTLTLVGIEKVSNAKDAQEASLSSKQNLHSISLIWRTYDGEAHAAEVFETLKPHNRLRVLEVHSYPGHRYPGWMNDPQQLQNLFSIKFESCWSCKDLPALGQLPLLEFLELSYISKVKHIISKTTWCGQKLNTKLFPSLKKLQIDWMENLEDWWEAEVSNAQILLDRQQIFPCLTKLSITCCKKLTTIPTIPSLQDLTLDSCNPNLATNIFSFTTYNGPGISQLQTLTISNCEYLVHLPACLPSTRKLEIMSCNSLKSLPGPGSLTKLQELKLGGCGGLVSLPRGMEALTHLNIRNCKRLTSLPEDLTKLNSLILYGCNGLVSLPQGIEDIIELHISGCNGLNRY